MNVDNALFLLGFSLLFTHEMDAVLHREWRLLFFLRDMPEDTAAVIFIVLHIPLLFLLWFITTLASSDVQFSSRVAIDAFLVIHAGLHWSLRNRPKYDFNSLISRVLIFATAVVGVLHLLVIFAIRN